MTDKCAIDICRSDQRPTIQVDIVGDHAFFRAMICVTCASVLNVLDGGQLVNHAKNRRTLEQYWTNIKYWDQHDRYRYCTGCGQLLDLNKLHMIVWDHPNVTRVCNQDCRDTLLEHRYRQLDQIDDPFDPMITEWSTE